jgi:energy-coupling factor transport system permease protein
LSLFIIQSLFFPEGNTVLARLGPLAIKAEGVRFAFASSARILLIAGAMLLTLITTHPGALMTALVQKGFPSALAYVIVTTLQIVPVMRERARTIVDAQRARGLETEGSIVTRVRALVPLIGPLVLGSLLDVEERSLALEARAFGATTPKTSLFDVPDPPIERLLRWSILLLIVAIIAFRLAQAFR